MQSIPTQFTSVKTYILGWRHGCCKCVAAVVEGRSLGANTEVRWLTTTYESSSRGCDVMLWRLRGHLSTCAFTLKNKTPLKISTFYAFLPKLPNLPGGAQLSVVFLRPPPSCPTQSLGSAVASLHDCSSCEFYGMTAFISEFTELEERLPAMRKIAFVFFQQNSHCFNYIMHDINSSQVLTSLMFITFHFTTFDSRVVLIYTFCKPHRMELRFCFCLAPSKNLSFIFWV